MIHLPCRIIPSSVEANPLLNTTTFAQIPQLGAVQKCIVGVRYNHMYARTACYKCGQKGGHNLLLITKQKRAAEQRGEIRPWKKRPRASKWRRRGDEMMRSIPAVQQHQQRPPPPTIFKSTSQTKKKNPGYSINQPISTHAVHTANTPTFHRTRYLNRCCS